MKTYTLKEVKMRAQLILSMPAGLKYGTINEIADMAHGGNADGIREQYYPGKPDSYFKAILAIVDGGDQ